MAGKVALLLWAQTLGLAGAQSPQIRVQPPWTPTVRWDQVALTCQGSGTPGDTTWYKDGQRWWQQGLDSITVTERGTYTCQRAGSGLSPPVTISAAPLVLQVSEQTLLEGDTVPLRCRGWGNKSVTEVTFYREEKKLRRFSDGTDLFLSPLQLNHSGHYSCRGWMESFGMWDSRPVTVIVQELFSVPVLLGPPEIPEGSPLNLSCLSTPSPLRPQTRLQHLFYRDGQVVGGPQWSPQLLLPAPGVSHSGSYSCQVRSEDGAVWKSSAELILQGTPGAPWHTVAAALGGSLLSLLLLVPVALGWRRCHNTAARKRQRRAPPDPPEEGEVLYTHVVSTRQTGASPRAAAPQGPQVTYAELAATPGRPRAPPDIYENALGPSGHGWAPRGSAGTGGHRGTPALGSPPSVSPPPLPRGPDAPGPGGTSGGPV